VGISKPYHNCGLVLWLDIFMLPLPVVYIWCAGDYGAEEYWCWGGGFESHECLILHVLENGGRAGIFNTLPGQELRGDLSFFLFFVFAFASDSVDAGYSSMPLPPPPIARSSAGHGMIYYM